MSNSQYWNLWRKIWLVLAILWAANVINSVLKNRPESYSKGMAFFVLSIVPPLLVYGVGNVIAKLIKLVTQKKQSD